MCQCIQNKHLKNMKYKLNAMLVKWRVSKSRHTYRHVFPKAPYVNSVEQKIIHLTLLLQTKQYEHDMKKNPTKFIYNSLTNTFVL